jgi:Fur family ferric uptake transcriptional regulator/Fur family peroxide stress response transcriptional regulator
MNIKVEVKNRLQNSGIKPSLQRMAILEYLMEHPVHPTVDMIFNDLYPSIPTLSKTTVYNALKLFLEQGAIRSLTIDEKNVRYDADISEHAHFKCKKCGNVHDFYPEGLDWVKLKGINQLFITECYLYFMGYCEECKGELGVRS